MKTNKYIKTALLSLGFIGIASSCGEDYLNFRPNEVIDDKTLTEQVELNEKYFNSQISGIYSFLFKPLQTQSGGAHEDFAQKSYDLETDMITGDVSLLDDAYGRFTGASTLETYKRTNHRSYAAWRVNYKIISEANNLFRIYLKSDTEIPKRDPNIKNILDDKSAIRRVAYAQLKFIRAYAYFQLANLYAGNYDEYKDKKVLPIYNLSTGAEIHEFSTLKEVYETIIKDLLQAKEVMGDAEFLKSIRYQRPNKLAVDSNVISAFLSYAYLTIGDYEKAYEVSSKVIDAGNVALMKAKDLTKTGFSDISHPDFLWGMDITKDTSGSLITFWGHMDVFTYSYASVGAAKLLNTYLAEQMPEYDLRKNWFGTIWEIPGFPINKFYSQTGRKVYEETKELGGDADWLSDIHFLRTEEFYLIAAEAAARKGDDAKSKEILIKLLKERTEESKINEMETAVNSYEHKALMDAIFYNWRIEMWGEGRALQTIKRFKATTKRSKTSFAYAEQEFKYNTKEYVYELPDNEVINNKYTPINH